MTSVTSGVGCPRLSIIIPTRNRPHHLRAVVNQLLNEQCFTDFELIIIDQTSDTPPVQYNDPRVHYHRVPLIGPLAGMNEGVVRTCGEIILFLNDDVYIPKRDFLAAHLACYLNPEVGGVGGRIIDRVLKPNTRRIQCKVSWTGRTVENLTGHKCCKLHSVKGTNMSFRAIVFWQVGLFDTGYTGTTLLGETDLATRVRAAGWNLIFAPKAELVHLAASSGGVRCDKLAWEYSRFRNTGYYVAKHRGFLGLLPFGLMFSAIAAKRAWQWREIGALPKLWRAMGEGVLAGQKQHRGRLGRKRCSTADASAQLM
jgi:GT2 family glycosyltransferase